MLYLTIRDGSSHDGRPIFANSDPELIATIGKFLAERLGVVRRARVMNLSAQNRRDDPDSWEDNMTCDRPTPFATCFILPFSGLTWPHSTPIW
jgi:hypothetical protein